MADIRRPSPQELLDLKGQWIPVSRLLELFGVRFRNHLIVPIISDALKEAGLTTAPYFGTCNSRADVMVVPVGTVDDPEPIDEPEDDGFSQGTLPQHSFKIGDMPTATKGLESVSPGAPLSQAITIMRTKNFSQVPVIDGLSELRGVVTWSSVAALYGSGKKPTLVQAMVTDSLPVAEVHQDLFLHLPTVCEHGYLLVRDNTGAIKGIITPADITTQFETTAKPFFQVGEIEFLLRKHLGAGLSPEAIRAVQTRGPRTGNIADLMFGQYLALFRPDPSNPQRDAHAERNWAALGWDVDRTMFLHHLRRVKDIRNKIAHFDSTPVSAERFQDLQQFAGLLKQLPCPGEPPAQAATTD